MSFGHKIKFSHFNIEIFTHENKLGISNPDQVFLAWNRLNRTKELNIYASSMCISVASTIITNTNWQTESGSYLCHL